MVKFEIFLKKIYARYIEVNMNSGATVWPLFNSLQAFWPGLQVWDLHISEHTSSAARIRMITYPT
jgi:hypothetical protein